MIPLKKLQIEILDHEMILPDKVLVRSIRLTQFKSEKSSINFIQDTITDALKAIQRNDDIDVSSDIDIVLEGYDSLDVDVSVRFKRGTLIHVIKKWDYLESTIPDDLKDIYMCAIDTHYYANLIFTPKDME